MDTNEVTIKNFRSIKEGDIPLKNSKELEEDFEEVPTILKEAKDFLNELPDRLYLDSDPEFHLNVHIVFSYLLLYPNRQSYTDGCATNCYHLLNIHDNWAWVFHLLEILPSSS